MKRVAASEHDLLTIARAMVGLVGAETAAPLVRQPRALAAELGPSSLACLRDILAKGAVLALGRGGGWIAAEHLDETGAPRRGRLWERVRAPELRFTATTLELCRWMTVQPLGSGEATRFRASAPLGPADELALYLACGLIARCQCASAVAHSPGFRGSPLCWVGFADVLSRHGPPAARDLPDGAYAGLVSERSFLLEALQQDLARRWLEMERSKGGLPGTRELLHLGQAQSAVLYGLSAAADRAGRRDLLGFVWRAAGRLLRHRPAAEQWLGSLSPESSLEERSLACREGGGGFLRSLLELQRWVEDARSRRFFDDDYAAAQLVLRQWEELGLAGSQHAQQVVLALEALDAPLRASDAARSEVNT